MVEGTAGQSRRIVRLVEQALRVLEQSGEEGLAALLREHPGDEGVVRARLELLAQSGLADPPPLASTAPGKLGEFVPLERLGEGGMGVVWRARQESLGRTVALKVIRPEYLWFEGARARFRREAEAVAKLRHPGIVPIYAVGEESGVPFLAFELVEGLPLDRVLGELIGADPARLLALRALEALAALDRRGPLPTSTPALFEGLWLDAALRIAIAVGDALAHAHSRGVLHRDLKPSNVMLTREGEVKLLDFGLASSEGAVQMTRDGSAPGSLAYMAPELLDRALPRADVRSEVYSLAVLLYQLLALKAPFEGGSVESVRARILGSAVEPLSRVHRGVPWELVAIVECAMERDPARRYADVTEMVADLRRAVAHEPIHARRAGFVRRAWRTAQRHPVAVTAITLTTALVIAVPLTFAWQQARIAAQETREAQSVRDALQISNLERERAERERARAEASELDLLTGVDRFFVQVGMIGLENIPGTDVARRRLMEDAQKLLVTLEERAGGRQEVTRALAKARVRQGELLTRFGELAQAEEAGRAGLALCERILVDHPEDVELLRYASLAEAALAAIAVQRDDPATALQGSRRSLAFLERAAVIAPRNWIVAEQLAIRAQDIGLALAIQGQSTEALEHFESAEASYARALALKPDHDISRFRVVARANWSAALGNLDRNEEARRVAELALEDVDEALRLQPADVDVRSTASTVWRMLRFIAIDTQDRALEARAVAAAVVYARWVFERFPERTSYRIELVEALLDWASLRIEAEEHSAGRALLEEAYVASQELGEAKSQRQEALLAACRSAQLLASRCARDGESERAALVASGALPLAFELAEFEPQRRNAVLRLGLTQVEALARTGRNADAVDAVRALHQRLALRRSELGDASLPSELLADAAFQALRDELPD